MQQIKQSTLDGGRTVGAREASATEGVVGCGGGDGMRRCGPGEWRGRAGLSDGGEIKDEQNRRSIYIGRDSLVLAGKTNRD